MKTRNGKDFVKVEMTVHECYKIITRPCPQSTKNPQKRWLQILSQVQEILKYFSLEQLNIFLNTKKCYLEKNNNSWRDIVDTSAKSGKCKQANSSFPGTSVDAVKWDIQLGILMSDAW